MATIERDGLMEVFTKAGATVLANACGPCIGQWQRDDIKSNETNSIVSSYNRNFRGRNDGNPETLSFIGSPEITVAMAYGGELSFNPLTDSVNGVKLPVPKGRELPAAGFVFARTGYLQPPAEGTQVDVAIDPASRRLQKLERF